MNQTIKMSLWGCALLLVACGPGVKIGGGKQGAAEALYAASGPTSGAADRNQQPVDVNIGADLSVSCRFGGKALLRGFSVVTDTTGGLTSVGQKFTIAYENCGAVETKSGVANLNGSYDIVQKVVAGTGSALVEQSFKGRVNFNGAFDDFLEADVTQKVEATQLTATSGGVSVNLVGKLTDSSGSYEFNEAVSVTAGNLSVQVTKQ